MKEKRVAPRIEPKETASLLLGPGAGPSTWL